jgi:hypothetical protein
MALLHHATITPGKRDLMTAWLPTRPWAAGLGEVTRTIASYRFDDPAGEVGIEAALLAVGDGHVVHVPMTYRSAPLDGAGDFLMGTADHSVLGPRWVYDACGDPVWAAAFATAIATGADQAEQYFEVDGRREPVAPRMSVHCSGSSDVDLSGISSVDDCHDDGPTTVVRCDDIELVVVRVVGTSIGAEETLTGRWGDQSGVLVGLRRSGFVR